jgi:subtilase family serine protease
MSIKIQISLTYSAAGAQLSHDDAKQEGTDSKSVANPASAKVQAEMKKESMAYIVVQISFDAGTRNCACANVSKKDGLVRETKRNLAAIK